MPKTEEVLRDDVYNLIMEKYVSYKDYNIENQQPTEKNYTDFPITNGELIAFINKNVSRQANQTPQLNGDPEKVLVQW
tara:strand:- start:19 stop:252 length:234 start_codon:yes stop_codon:yes gene_type:complete